MVNTLGGYDPVFYAQEALLQLENALGAVSRIHRGYDRERRSFRKGQTINIHGPGSFTAQDAPSSSQDMDTDELTLTLNNWREVKFELPDDEHAFTGDQIIEDHIRPAAYALANDMESKFYDLYYQVPWYHDVGTAAVSDITSVNKILFDNKVPRDGRARTYALSSKMEAELMNLEIFHTANKGGDRGAQNMAAGFMANGFGFDFLATQNAKTHDNGDMAATAGALLKGAHAAGASSITIDDATSLTGTIKQGDIITIAGNTQQYAVTANATAASNEATISITPNLVQAYSDNAAVTLDQEGTKTEQSLAFHRNWCALATAPLHEKGNELGGVRIATITDPDTQLSMRSRIWYDANNSKMMAAIDVLYGFLVLDPNLAVRSRQAP